MMPDWFLVLTLIVVGFILLLIELFIIPGFGIVGISGLASLGVASYIAYSKLSPLMGLVISIGSLCIIFLSLKLFSKTAIWKKLRLDKTESTHNGFSHAENLGYLINKEGVAITSLRPSGSAKIDGKRYDVITEGTFVSEHARIRVLRVEGSKVIVKEIT
ncbi:MAG: NfeD family protein [Candidatus Omnitrophota bacterium]